MLITLAIPHPKSLKPTPLTIWKIRHFFTLSRRGAAAKIRANGYRYIDELWRRWSPAWKDLPASETAAVKESFAHDGSLEAACAYYAAANPRKLPQGHKPNIQVPSVSFAGEDDIIAPRAYEKARHCYDASYEVIQVPGGHFMHREHPEEFIPELVRTLRDAAR
jgi:pimeloyl-ACP methyl ester carboxylesterase